MSDKVVITKEQAEAIELFFTNEYWDKKDILGAHAKSIRGWDKYSGINGMDFDTLAKALYIGYTVEPTPEDIILKRYKDSIEIASDSADKFKSYYQGQADAIETVLRLLKIEIEGIQK